MTMALSVHHAQIQPMALEAHEVAELFPPMDEEEYRALVDDIRIHGLHEPIWLHPDGRIIDGRHRYRACLEAGCEPRFRTWAGHGSLVSFVVSLNLRRRHLTTAQCALLGVDLLPYLEAEARTRRLATLKQNAGAVHRNVDARAGGQALDHAAAAVKSNRQYVADARRIIERAPDVAEAMRRGAVPTMNVARAMAALPAPARRAVLAKIEEQAPRCPIRPSSGTARCWRGRSPTAGRPAGASTARSQPCG